jgi:hypothetical protein
VVVAVGLHTEQQHKQVEAVVLPLVLVRVEVGATLLTNLIYRLTEFIVAQEDVVDKQVLVVVFMVVGVGVVTLLELLMVA